MNFYQTTGFCSAEEQEAGITADVNKGPWTAEEDSMLMNYVTIHGEGRWNSVAQKAGLKRTGKSCRLRWLNYLRPDLLRGDMSPQEQLLILELHSRWGNKWSKMAHYLPGRTDNEIKNYWRTRVQKQAKLLQCDVNSKKFRAAVKYVWMPRLREKITSTMVTQFDHVDQMRQRQQGFAVPDSSSFLPDEISVSDSDKSPFRLISELFDDGYDNDQAIQISQPLLDASDLSRFIAVPPENSSSTADNSSFSHETLVSDLSEGYEYNQWVPEYEDGNTWAGVACEGGDHDLLMTMDDWWSEESMRFLQEQLSDGGF